MSNFAPFDATGIAPQQSTGAHPPGMYGFAIANTYIKDTKDGNGGMLVIELRSEAGSIENRYNLWNQSETAVKIARAELSALCHAVGIMRITFPVDANNNPIKANAAMELRGGKGRMEVGPQKTNPDYMEVKKVYDINGNEPGKAPAAQPQQAAAPQQAAPAAWNGTGAGAPQQAANGPGWQAGPTVNAQTEQQPQAASGWQQGPSAGGANPPWAAKG